MNGCVFGIFSLPNVFSIGRCSPAPAVAAAARRQSQRIGEIASRPESPPPLLTRCSFDCIMNFI